MDPAPGSGCAIKACAGSFCYPRDIRWRAWPDRRPAFHTRQDTQDTQRSPHDRNGVATFRIGEVRPGRALPLLRGLGVREHGGNEPCSSTLPPLAPIHSGSSITKPQREFTSVRPVGLALACGAVMVGRSWACSRLGAPRHHRRGAPRREQETAAQNRPGHLAIVLPLTSMAQDKGCG